MTVLKKCFDSVGCWTVTGCCLVELTLLQMCCFFYSATVRPYDSSANLFIYRHLNVTQARRLQVPSFHSIFFCFLILLLRHSTAVQCCRRGLVFLHKGVKEEKKGEAPLHKSRRTREKENVCPETFCRTTCHGFLRYCPSVRSAVRKHSYLPFSIS